jgi:hypothetical protein
MCTCRLASRSGPKVKQGTRATAGRPAVDSPAVDSPAVDSPAVDSPGQSTQPKTAGTQSSSPCNKAGLR